MRRDKNLLREMLMIIIHLAGGDERFETRFFSLSEFGSPGEMVVIGDFLESRLARRRIPVV